MDNLKRTALFNLHSRYGGKFINFAGWELPVQYEGIIQEHEAVRSAAGAFDVSHMGEIEIKGTQASGFLQYLITNDISVLKNNQIIYTMMCYETGGVVDDLLVYKFNDEYYYLVVNASNIEKDFQWMLDNKGSYNVEIINVSNEISQIAIQGPRSEEVLQRLTDTNLSNIQFFYCSRDVLIHGVKCLISRTGYTGEDGFEIFTSNENIETLWEKILEAGKNLGLKPAGLGCRDTLRFEAALPLYGNEISEDISPFEAGLNSFVKLNKENFIGKAALEKQNQEGLKRKLVGFEMLERGISRHGYIIMLGSEKIGFVTTGYFSPTLKKNIGLALIDSKYSKFGTEISVIIRNKPVKAKVVSKKFYEKNYKK